MMGLKQKNIALLIAFILLLWFSYLFSFSKTFELKEHHRALQKEQELLSNVSQKLVELKQQEVYYDSILRSKKISIESSFQNNLLSKINEFADATNIKVISFQNPHVFGQDGAEVLTYSFTLRGSFNQITRLIYQLEQSFKLGKVISVKYLKKRDYRRRSDYLECTILLQRIAS